MLALLGLLLAGAEPSSHGFLTGKVNQALDGDNTRAFATNVVHHRANDSNNTMHNYEVQLTCMDHHATHNQLSVLKLTSPLHAAQCEEVHPRYPNWIEKNNHVSEATCTSDDHHADLSEMLRTDTDNATLLVLSRQPTGNRTGEPPVAWVILRYITEEYQYFLRKPPPPIKSRRRRRYDERLAHLAARGGRTKKRRRLGPPGATFQQPPVPHQQSCSLLATTINFINQILVKIYLPGLATTIFLCVLDMLAVGSTETNANITFAFFLSMTALFAASTWIAAGIAFVWTVPRLATAFISITTHLAVWCELWANTVTFAAKCVRHRPLVHIPALLATFIGIEPFLANIGLGWLFGDPAEEQSLWTWNRKCTVYSILTYWTYYVYAQLMCAHPTCETSFYTTARIATRAPLILLAEITAFVAKLTAISPLAAYLATRRLLHSTWLMAVHTYRWLVLIHRQAPLSLMTLLMFYVRHAAGMNDEGSTSSTSKMRPPMFSGERTDYTKWLIAFTVWVACYLQECALLLEGTDPEPPKPDDLPAETPEAEVTAARTTHDKWTARNRKLFGALGMAMPQWLMQSLYTSCLNSGVLAVAYMRASFSAVNGNGNDRAAAVNRLQKSHIDPKSDLCEQDVRTQYDSMMLAVSDLTAAGAAAPDQPMLISMFENALPQSYTVIRQMVRRQNHVTLLAYYNDILREVRAELQSRAPSVHAFGASVSQPVPQPVTSTHDANITALVSALQAMGYTKPGGKPGDGKKRSRDPYPSEPCLICGIEGHTREKCRKAANANPCRFCGKKGHAAPYCPHNPTAGGKRKALAPNLRALVDREAGPTPLPNVAPGAPGTSASHSPASYAAAVQQLTEADAQTHAATAAAQHSDPSAMAAAYVAALQACGYASCAIRAVANAAAPPEAAVPLPPAARATKPASSTVVPAFVDSMATYFVVDNPAFLVRITDHNPNFGVKTADGVKPILAIGVAHVWISDPNGLWKCYEVPNVLLLPKCDQVLYSVRIMRDLFGFTHDFDAAISITMPGRPALQMRDNGTSFAITVAFSTTAVSASRRVRPIGNVAALSASGSVVPAPAPPASSVGTPQSLLYQRLAFPYAQAWRHVASSTRGHNLPPGVVMNGSLPVRDAVMRGRARALPFFTKPPADHTPPPPGAVIFMDFAGPVSPSFPHGLTTYCGAIDAGSLYGRVMAAHTMTRDIASQTLSMILSDIAAKMKSAVPVKPFVVNCDNGSAFISKHFREFLADRQIALRLSPPYTPQLNAQIESMWCTTFATARVLLASASLPPSLHPFAMQTARWIENRLPKPTRGNQTPVYMLSKELPDLSYLYTFGCLCLVTLPGPLREGDQHFMDRGAPGLYLGPSEEGLCHIVYVFALRRVLPTAKLRVWEDQFPGLRGLRYEWFPSLPAVSSEGPVPSDPSSDNTNEPTPHNNNNSVQSPPADIASSPSPPDTASSPPLAAALPPTASGPATDFAFGPATAFDPPSPATAPRGPATVTASNPNAAALPRGDTGNPSDPQSRVFHRVMPSRSSRNSNPNYASLAGHAALAVAASTFTRLNSLIAHSLASPGSAESDPHIAGPAMAFACHSLSTDGAFINFTDGGDNNLMTSLEVAATIFAASIVSTADYGEIPIPRGYKAAMSGNWASYWRAAIDKELAGLIALRTWDLIPASSIPRGSNLMNCHYVFDVKRLRDGTVDKFKARLVADGNTQKFGIDYNRIFATVIKTSTIRLVLIIAAARDYNLTQIDIRQAYLQAELPEKLYMRVPPGIPSFNEKREPLVCCLNRSLYGLKQAGREWGVLFASFLTSWGFVRSTIDTCLFTYDRSGLILWVLVYVDDCIIVDNSEDLRSRFVTDLGKRFPVDDRGELEWMLGLAVRRDRANRVLTLSQELYIKDLVDRYASYISAGHNRKYDTPVEEGLRLSHDDCPTPGSADAELMLTLKPIYMALVGAFLWLGSMTYSEVQHVTTQLARFVSNPGPKHIAAAWRVLIYLDGQRTRALRFEPNASLPLHVYVDSSWESKFSCSGAYYFFMGCHFHWFSKLQRSVSLSSAEAEFFGCMLALKDALWLRQLLLDLGVLAPGPTQMWCDSKSAVALALDPVAFKNTKHILRAAEFLKDHVLRGSVTISHSKGSTMVADILTKGQARPVFLQLMKLLLGYSKNPVADIKD